MASLRVRPRRRAPRGSPSGLALLVVAALTLGACSEETFGELGSRSSGWIDEVATTRGTTTTTSPATTRRIAQVSWVNDEFSMAPGLEPDAVLSAVYARSGNESRFLQASREEIGIVTPGVLFPRIVPADVRYVTSQLVIESGTLRLAEDPTVAFGMWSVEPYTRSRSIGQVGVLNVATDPGGAEVANDPGTEATCARFSGQPTRLCSVEEVEGRPTWRLETETGVTHVFYQGQFRYELFTRPDIDDGTIHVVLGSVGPLTEIGGEVASSQE